MYAVSYYYIALSSRYYFIHDSAAEHLSPHPPPIHLCNIRIQGEHSASEKLKWTGAYVTEH